MKGWYTELFISVIIAAFFLVFLQVTLVSGQSMEPTYSDGDRLWMVKHLTTYERDDVVVFEAMINDRMMYVIKRVIAVGGDRVDIEKGIVKVNGVVRQEKYVIGKTDVVEPLHLTVPKNQLFVLGDNREHSGDSRAFGTVPEQQVIGEVKLRFSFVKWITKGLK